MSDVLDDDNTAVVTTPRPDFREPGDDDKFAHYVDKNELMEATINGTPIQALCGKMWVPTRDALKFPVCPECREIWESMPDDD